MAQVLTTVERDEEGQPCGIDSPLEDPARLRDILAEFLAGTATPISYHWLESFCSPAHPQPTNRSEKTLPRAGMKSDEYADLVVAAQAAVRNNGGGVQVFAEEDGKGPFVLGQTWNLFEIWCAKATGSHVSALLDCDAVLDVHRTSIRGASEPDEETINAQKAVEEERKAVRQAALETPDLFEQATVELHEAFRRWHEELMANVITKTKADTVGWAYLDTHVVGQRLRSMPSPFTQFSHGATDTLGKAARRVRELLGAAIKATDAEQGKLRLEKEEIEMGESSPTCRMALRGLLRCG